MDNDLNVRNDQTPNTAEAIAAPVPASQVTDGDGRNKPIQHYVVGIGASAGGLDAIERFFDNVPADSGLSFVLIQHLSPDFKSLMDELLARHTRMPIRRVQDGMPVEPNAIYLIPPKKTMVLSNGRLLLTDLDQKAALTMPIDVFLRSLAQDAGDRAIGIVLSGSGSDGSRGVRDIHEAGGLVLVQSVETATFDGMPRAALGSGMADFVLPPEEMPACILRYINHPAALATDDAGVARPPTDELSAVLTLLRRQFGVDFSLYKPGTIARRLERRVTLGGSGSLTEYVRGLENDPSELDALYRDLLVEVTQFFRDRDAFDILKHQVIPALCDQAAATGEESLRVWVPGCATGEEAYSLAILFHEYTQAHQRSLDVKIFASDVHRSSLDFAGNGLYSEQSMHTLPAPYLSRYFLPKRDRFLVCQEIRQMVIFALHNLTKDPPFTKMDLISCRNLLIYFNPATQKKVLSLFHFGLKTGGVLFLGPSESVAELEGEFETVDGRWKVYRKRRDVRLPATRFTNMQPLSESAMFIKQRLISQAAPDDGMSDIYEALLHRFVPPSLLLNEKHELLHAFGDARKFLHVPEGRATTDVLRMLDDPLRMAFSSALYRAGKEHKPVSYSGVRTHVDSDEYRLKVTVIPLPNKRSRSTMYLVSLEEEKPPEPSASAVESFDLQGEVTERIQQLERDLVHSKEHLQSTIEELETSNEELQSTNEELVASNEELQSTNEELHSVNEELYTVNAEHQRKIEELLQLTNDMDNLLHSTEIGTLFLDNDLNIRKFTPAIARVFNLMTQDVGRPLRHISNNIGIPYQALHEMIERTLIDGKAVEQEVTGAHGETFLMHVLPYRTQNGIVTGSVLTFVDVSALKESQRQLAANQRRLAMALEVGDICVWEWDLRSDVVHVGDRFPPFFGITLPQLQLGQAELAALVHADDRGRFQDAVQRAVRDQERKEVEFRIPQHDGTTRFALMRLDVECDSSGEAARVIGVCIDISQRRHMQAALMESRQLVQAIMDNSTASISAKDLDGRYLFINQSLLRLLGLAGAGQALGKTDHDLLPMATADALRHNDRKVIETGIVLESEEVIPQSDGLHYYFLVKFPLRNAAGAITGVASIATDITERKRAEDKVREALVRRDQFLAMLSHELRNPLGAILSASYLLQQPEAAGDAWQDAREVIQRQAHHMVRLLDDLLDVSRIAQNKVHLHLESLVLNQVVQEAIQICMPVAQQAGLELEVDLGEEPLHARGDATRLQQVVVNLLTNAIRYTPGGGHIWLSLHREGEIAVLRVRDDGVGIASQKLEAIFDLFVQAHETLDRTRGGLGVGLTLVRNIVELHGGKISAFSAGPEQGSEFTVSLPLVAARPERQGTLPAEVDGVGKARIVVVEDIADSRRMLESLLRLDGYEVHSAADGQEGLRLIVECRPDLALVDIGLPVLDGYQLAREVRAQLGPKHPYLVALTGYGRPDDRRAILQAGFDEHLVKPLRRSELLRVLNSIQSAARPAAT